MDVLILGAGFGGLELATTLAETPGASFDVVLIDKSDAFVFGYSKLDVMFGRTTLDAVRLPYSNFAHAGVKLLRETVTAIDPERRRVTTDAGVHEADVLVVALGADYDIERDPRPRRMGRRVLFDRRRATRGERAALFNRRATRGERAAWVHGRTRDHRCVRHAVQVPAGAERSCAPSPRLPDRTRHS